MVDDDDFQPLTFGATLSFPSPSQTSAQDSDVLEWALTKPGVLTEYSERVIPDAATNPLHIVPVPAAFRWSDAVPYVPCAGTGEFDVFTISAFGLVDVATASGKAQAASLVDFLASESSCAGARVAFMANLAPGADPAGADAAAARLVYAAGQTAAAGHTGDALALLQAVLGGQVATAPEPADVCDMAVGVDVDGQACAAFVAAAGDAEAFSAHVSAARTLARTTLGAKAGATVLFVNGRVIEAGTAPLTANELRLLAAFETSERSGPLLEAMEASATYVGVSADDQTAAFISDVLAAAVSVLGVDSRRAVRRSNIPSHLVDALADISVDADPDAPRFNLVAFVDPLSTTAQRFTPILMSLRGFFNLNLRMVLNPVADLGELPLTKVRVFYLFACLFVFR